MTFPHPQSGKDHYRNEDKPSRRGVVWNFLKRTINITEYRDAKDDVNPAKNRALGCVTDHFVFLLDSRILSRLRRPVGRFDTELLGVLRLEPLPAVELHGLGVDDAADGSSTEKAIQNIERNVPARGAPRDEAAIDVVPQRQASAAA